MNRFLWIVLAFLVAFSFQNCSESNFIPPQQTPLTNSEPESSSDELQPLVILAQPQDQSVFPNQPAEFSVTVNDPTDVTYQWYFGSQQLAGEVGPSLQIPSAKLEDAGEYYVTLGRNGQAQMVSEPGALTVSSPVVGNLSLAVGVGPETIDAGSVVLALCPAGSMKISNLTVQNIPDVDQNEGAPGFVDFALCEKNALLAGNVKLSLAVCEAGYTSVASVMYQNVSNQDFGRGAPDNVVLHICEQNGAIGPNVALSTAACPAGFNPINTVSFQNTGNFEDGQPAPLNVSIQLCGK